MEKDEIGRLAREHHVQQKSVRRLLNMGVGEGDVSDVLDHRSTLSDLDEKGNVAAIAGVASVAEAYHAVEEDMQLFSCLVDKAHDLAEEIFGEWLERRNNQRVMRMRFSVAMYEVTREFEERGLQIIDD